MKEQIRQEQLRQYQAACADAKKRGKILKLEDPLQKRLSSAAKKQKTTKRKQKRLQTHKDHLSYLSGRDWWINVSCLSCMK